METDACVFAEDVSEAAGFLLARTGGGQGIIQYAEGSFGHRDLLSAINILINMIPQISTLVKVYLDIPVYLTNYIVKPLTISFQLSIDKRKGIML